jgi:hypothetical protein
MTQTLPETSPGSEPGDQTSGPYVSGMMLDIPNNCCMNLLNKGDILQHHQGKLILKKNHFNNYPQFIK